MAPHDPATVLCPGCRVNVRGKDGEFLLLAKADTVEGPIGWIYAPGTDRFDSSAPIPLDSLSLATVQPPTPEDFVAKLVAEDLSNPWTMTPRTAFSARAVFKPFQFRPLLKFFGLAGRRLLVADEAGLGKTVEAGYIIAEGIARGDFRRTVILCPSHLRSKWRWELRSRFGLWFQIVNSRTLLELLARSDRPFQLIISIDGGRDVDSNSLAARLRSGSLDLLVVDEIHKLIGRGGDTLRRGFGQALSLMSDSILGLSATPVQLAITDLQRVLDIVAPGIFDDATFERDLEASRVVLQIEQGLRLAAQGGALSALSPQTHELEELSSRLSREERERVAALTVRLKALSGPPDETALIDLLRDTTELTQLSRHITRARSVEVGEHRERILRNVRLSLRKDERTVVQDGDKVTVSEDGLYRRIDRFLGESFSPVHRLQLSSSLPAIVGLLKNGLRGYRTWEASAELHGVSPGSSTSPDRPMTQDEQKECDALVRLYSARPRDSKWTALARHLEEYASRGEVRKAIVFTHWIPTYRYLTAQLDSLKTVRWVGIGPQLSEEETEGAIRRFQGIQGFAVLLATDRLSEGVDLEAADCVINYDLPYNPQVLEQRIGRVDRVGQKSPTILIVNLIVEGSLDERIYSVILERTGVFTRFVGEMRPITEEMMREIDAPRSDAANRLLGGLKELQTRTELMEHPVFAGVETVLPSDIQRMHRLDSHSLRGLDWRVISQMFCSIDPDCNPRWDSAGKELVVGPVASAAIEALLRLIDHEERLAVQGTLNRTKDSAGRYHFSFVNEAEDLPRGHPMYDAALRLIGASIPRRHDLPLTLEVQGTLLAEGSIVNTLVVGEFRFQGRSLRRRETRWWVREGERWREWDADVDLPVMISRLVEGGRVHADIEATRPLYASLRPVAEEKLGPWARSLEQADRLQRRNAILNELSSLSRRVETISGSPDPNSAPLQPGPVLTYWAELRERLARELDQLSKAGDDDIESQPASVTFLAGFTHLNLG